MALISKATTPLATNTYPIEYLMQIICQRLPPEDVDVDGRTCHDEM
jgi:hypothetical protein